MYISKQSTKQMPYYHRYPEYCITMTIAASKLYRDNIPIVLEKGPCYKNYVATRQHISRSIIRHGWSAVCQQVPQRKIHKYGGSAFMTCINLRPYGRQLLNSQKGGVSLDWPCLETLMSLKLTPLRPAFFDCYSCLGGGYIGATTT